MEEKKPCRLEKLILPQDLYEAYVIGRTKGYAGGTEATANLNFPGFKGYQNHQDSSPYYYQDSFRDDQEAKPGSFSGFELVTQGSYFGRKVILYHYRGNLTKEGQKTGEDLIWSKLIKFLSDHVHEVRFGKTIRFVFENESGMWIYESDGKRKTLGWEDKERISRNGVVLYELEGTGFYFPSGV